MIIEVTDTVGTSGSVTIKHYDFADTVTPWYPEAPADVTEAIGELQDALNTGGYVCDLAEYLGLQLGVAGI